jgi:hypothetical protein
MLVPRRRRPLYMIALRQGNLAGSDLLRIF